MSKKRNAERLSDAVGEVNGKYIAEASEYRKRRYDKRRVVLIVAAVVILISTILAIFAMNSRVQNDPPSVTTDATTDAKAPPYIPDTNVTLLQAGHLSQGIVNGSAAKTSGSEQTGAASESPPAFRFEYYRLVVAAKAIRELPDVYETLSDYGSVQTFRYRVFVMQVTDPLRSGMTGEFYYALREDLKGDLIKYDTLLLAMDQQPKDYIMKNTATNELTAFNCLFDIYSAELGNVIAFTDGAFDESLWQDRSWLYGYQFARFMLDEPEHYLNETIVFRGSTYEQAREKLFELMDNSQNEWGSLPDRYIVIEPKTDEAKAIHEYTKPFVNGTFQAIGNGKGDIHGFRRYIGGCPTNEIITIDNSTEKVSYSEFSFSAEDMEGLPDIGAYIGALDLSSVYPQHIELEEKERTYCSAVGWYEKAASGVYSIVRISFQYIDGERNDDGYRYCYYDETFLLLEADGVRLISREELTELIGENQNISYGEYGQSYIFD